MRIGLQTSAFCGALERFHIKLSSSAKADDPVPRDSSVSRDRSLLDTPLSRGMTADYAACFPALLAPNRDREIGGGRATRQPGQVRKEAALTRSGSGRSSVSYLFFERIAPAALSPAPGARSFPQKPAERIDIADRSMTDAGAPHHKPDSADQGGLVRQPQARRRRSQARRRRYEALSRAGAQIPSFDL